MKKSMGSLIILMLFARLLTSAQESPFSLEHVLPIGGSMNDGAEHIDYVISDIIVTFGQFRSTIDFNPQGLEQNISALGNPDLFLASHNIFGELNWALNLGRIGLTDGLSAGGLVANEDGSILIVGAFSSIVNFNPLGINTSLTAVAGRDAFVAKYSAQGILLWVKSLGDVAFESGTAVASDNDSNIYVAISFAGQLDVDPGPSEVVLQSAGGTDAALIKLSPNGDYLWHRHISTSGNDEVSAIGCSVNTDRLGLAGHINGTIDPIPQVELFSSMMTLGGNEVWTINYNNLAPGNRMRKVAFDLTTSNVFFGGEIQTTTDFNPGTGESVVNPLFKDVFIACYDVFNPVNNAFRYVISPRGAGIAENLAFVYPYFGKLFFGGSFDVDIQFEEGNTESYFSSAGQRDVFLAAFYISSAQPVFATANIFGAVGDEFVVSGIIKNDVLTLAGSFVPSLGLNPESAPIITAGGRDAFWARFGWPYSLSAAGNQINQYGITLYPVPTGNELGLMIDSEWKGAIKVSLISSVGKVLAIYEHPSLVQNQSISVSSLSAGIYFLEFEINGSRITKRFVKN